MIEICHLCLYNDSVDETAHVDPNRCIGCGVCVPECPSEALIYEQKAPSETYVPPKRVAETYLKIAKERGLL